MWLPLQGKQFPSLQRSIHGGRLRYYIVILFQNQFGELVKLGEISMVVGEVVRVGCEGGKQIGLPTLEERLC